MTIPLTPTVDLRAARTLLKRTRPEMARYTGLPRRTIEKIEMGDGLVRLTAEQRVRLAMAYDLPPEAFAHCPEKLSDGRALEVLTEPIPPTPARGKKTPAPRRSRKEIRSMLEDKVTLSDEELTQLGLNANPFPDRPRAGKLFMWADLAKLMQKVDRALQQDSGMVAVVGPSGAGKSTFLWQLRENLQKSGDVRIVELATVDRGRLTDTVVEKAILAALKVLPKKINAMGPADRLLKLRELLTAEVTSGTRVILMGDDFHDTSPAVLKVLRRLREADPRYYLFGSIFMGQPDLASTLSSPELREVSGRTQLFDMPVLARTDPRGGKSMNCGAEFLAWHFAQIGLGEADFTRCFTPEGAAAIAEMAVYPLWTRNLAARALKRVAGLKRPVDPTVLSKLTR